MMILPRNSSRFSENSNGARSSMMKEPLPKRFSKIKSEMGYSSAMDQQTHQNIRDIKPRTGWSPMVIQLYRPEGISPINSGVVRSRMIHWFIFSMCIIQTFAKSQWFTITTPAVVTTRKNGEGNVKGTLKKGALVEVTDMNGPNLHIGWPLEEGKGWVNVEPSRIEHFCSNNSTNTIATNMEPTAAQKAELKNFFEVAPESIMSCSLLTGKQNQVDDQQKRIQRLKAKEEEKQKYETHLANKKRLQEEERQRKYEELVAKVKREREAEEEEEARRKAEASARKKEEARLKAEAMKNRLSVRELLDTHNHDEEKILEAIRKSMDENFTYAPETK